VYEKILLKTDLNLRGDYCLQFCFLPVSTVLYALKGCLEALLTIVRNALELNAVGVILAHNHPSGIAEPSSADRGITTRIKDALEVFDINVLDHFVVTAGECCSFADRGWL
jgi:hypothetical protein